LCAAILVSSVVIVKNSSISSIWFVGANQPFRGVEASRNSKEERRKTNGPHPRLKKEVVSAKYGAPKRLGYRTVEMRKILQSLYP